MRALRLLLWAGTGCAVTPQRDPGAPPDILVVAVGAGWSGGSADSLVEKMAHYPQSQAIHTDASVAMRALLTGQWPGTTSSSVPNTLHGVLKLYGYRTVGALPESLLTNEAPWLSAGLDPEPFRGQTCLADQLGSLSDVHPQKSDKAVATVLVSVDPSCDPAADHAALADHLAGPVAIPRITMIVGLDGGDWTDEDGAPAPFLFHGPGTAPLSLEGFASVVDVVPTVLPLADAVVPSDAIGSALVREGVPVAGPELLFQQSAAGPVGIRTDRHLLYVPDGAQSLPEQPPASLHYLPLAGNTDPLDTVRAPLYGALVQWDRQRRATSAADRMGSGAFREMLRDQGYWH